MPSKPILLAGLFLAASVSGFSSSSQAFTLSRAPGDMVASDDFQSLLAEPGQAEAHASAAPTSNPGVLAAKVAMTSLDPSATFDADISAAVTQSLYKMPRKRLAEFAMKLTDIRYRRGGHEPSTGFDCSGFVHYVFNKTFGLEMPFDAPSQFLNGEKVARDQMKTGDLVFFHEGKRITHVGIYLDDGRFIHSPSPGKRVRIDRLDSTYWAKRFAGAKRPDVLS